ncbi:MAG: hypothetical protein ACKO7Z_03825 [Cyanobacteriota bacterium]
MGKTKSRHTVNVKTRNHQVGTLQQGLVPGIMQGETSWGAAQISLPVLRHDLSEIVNALAVSSQINSS